VLGLYRARVWQMVRGMAGVVRIGPGDAAGLRLAINIVVAFIPAAVLGVLLNDVIEARLFHAGPVLVALGVGGVYMMVVDRLCIRRHRVEWGVERSVEGGEGREGGGIETLTPGRALVIGLLQVVAMWPGTSRSMMTITGGVLVGLRPRDAAEFSFLLGLPTLGGACVYSLAKNLKESGESGGANLFDSLGVGAVVIGLVVATISAAVAVRWLVAFLNRHGLFAFGVYRLALCAMVGALWAAGLVVIGG